jgi:hypothetical protein
MLHALGIRFENPTMTETEALQLTLHDETDRYTLAAD